MGVLKFPNQELCTTIVGVIEAELVPPSETEIFGTYVATVVKTPDIKHVVPVMKLHPLNPAGNPLDVQVSVPAPQLLAVMVWLTTCPTVYGPSDPGEIEHVGFDQSVPSHCLR